MAADNRSIVITLKLDSGKDAAEESPTDTEATQQESDNGSTAKAVAVFAIINATQIVTSEVSAWAEYYWNKELTLNDDYVGQRNKNIAMTQINRVTNALSTIGSMAAAGAIKGGWIGAIIGAALGTVTSISGFVRSNIQGQEQQNIALKQMDAQLQFTRSRAGWSLQAASIGEDL